MQTIMQYINDVPGVWRIKNIMTRANIRGIILMYHRVVNLDYDALELCVSKSHFEEHIQVINKYFQAVQIQKMANNLNKLSFGKKEIVITFDDGYADNFHNAKPILERYGTPATFYVVTGALNGKEEFSATYLEKAILESPDLPSIFEISISGKKYRWLINQEEPCRKIDYSQSKFGMPLNNESLSRARLFFALTEIISTTSIEKRKEIFQQIADWTGEALLPRQDYLPMTSNELCVLANSNIFEIGAHTLSHSMLSCLSAKEQEKEVIQNKQYLENLLNRKIISFSYPYGNYSSDTVRIIERLGFQNACTVVHRAVIRNTNPYLLPRYAVLDWDGDFFENKLRNWLTQLG
jgi:peptidoglycan/xylan/chitin deacetylase (PgdA/CDA1 family)